MTNSSCRIFVVDNDPVARKILAEEVSFDNNVVHLFEDGLQCLQSLDLAPDIIIMDVEMPNIDGYETCKRLKAQPDSKDTTVIFVSNRDSIEDKLAGYDAGGSDYLVKPIQAKELQKKISLAICNKNYVKQHTNEKQQAIETAITAMSSAGELGFILEFMRESYTVKTVDQLAELIIDTFRNFTVRTSVQLRTKHGVVSKSSTGSIPALEEELLTQLKDSGRIMERDDRLISNFGEISLLIITMPEEEGKRGRLRDHLAILLEAAETKLKVLEAEQYLSEIINDAKKALEKIEPLQQAQQKSSMIIIDEVMQNVATTVIKYGLTEDEEQAIINIILNGVNKSLDNLDKGIDIDEELRSIIVKLESFLEKTMLD